MFLWCGIAQQLLLVTNLAVADETSVIDPVAEGPQIEKQGHVIVYTAAFFKQYSPTSALEIVQQIPGFQIDDGDVIRGFGSTTGNILINDKYPSAKQERPSSILERIPANQVERIELIRGQVRDINLQGKSVVANIILRNYEQAMIRWDSYIQHNNHGPAKPSGRISLANRWWNIEYLAGLKIEREASGEEGPEKVFDASDLLSEIRYDKRKMTGHRITVNLNASTMIGDTLVKVNSNMEHKTNNAFFTSQRIRQLTGEEEQNDSVDEEKTTRYFEAGADLERNLVDNLKGKAIFLYFNQEMPIYTVRQVLDNSGNQDLLREATSKTTSTEGIARSEIDWSGLTDHVVQINIEGSYNALDSFLLQTDDRGNGPNVVYIPGANDRVEEVRGDFQVNDIWSAGKFEVEYGVGAEISTITQTGDADQNRTFSFLKPSGALAYSPGQKQQVRFRIAREVSQLDFNDFVSATVFEDNDSEQALGNPDLQPESTWIAELSHNWRYSQNSVIGIKVFHHWISEVEDLLPLTDVIEIPGNIGEGKRWGVEFESTLPLEWAHLAGAKLDIKTRWQDSTVIDPVTGKKRVLSAIGDFAGEPSFKFNSENKYTINVAYRQDFQEQRIAWGWDISKHAKRPLFKVNHLDVYHEGVLLNAFIETTRWYGMKMGFEGENLFDYIETRDRTFYVGSRELTPVDYVLARGRTPGRRLTFYLSGSF